MWSDAGGGVLPETAEQAVAVLLVFVGDVPAGVHDLDAAVLLPIPPQVLVLVGVRGRRLLVPDHDDGAEDEAGGGAD